MSDSLASSFRAKKRYLEISGVDDRGHSKAHVMFTHLCQYSDGTQEIVDELVVSRKPIVHIFHHAGYVNVTLDFHSSQDADLAMVWQLLQHYSDPINSVDWLSDELESGFYTNEAGDQCPVFFPMLQLGLHAINREDEFGIIGMNPLFFTLCPNSPTSTEACVLQLTFDENWFHVTEQEQIAKLDLQQLREEAAREIALEMKDTPIPDLNE